jgi:hypothetical protein
VLALTSIAYFVAAPFLPPAAGQPPCPRATLPAYAHNDYENSQPLVDALRLGFSGVEADVFLVDGVLRVGHDRRQARRGGTLEALYLTPLREIISRCARLTTNDREFLLAIEIKESSPATFDALVLVLDRYPDLFTPTSSSRAPIEVVLVGWHPQPRTLGKTPRDRFGAQHRISSPTAIPAVTNEVRLLSVDFGKAVARQWGRRAERRRWLASLRATKASNPDRVLRVHNVPADSMIYGALLDAGVDLIGTKDLAKTRLLLNGRELR